MSPSLQTYRIRKIKCDERRPFCDKCTKTQRKCDGYGIWTDKTIASISKLSAPITPQCRCASPREAISFTLPLLDIAYEERDHLEWFRLRTSTKLPGLFISCFWNSLLIQACLSEDAVLHAVLAISSLHKAHMLAEAGDLNASLQIRASEQRTLRHYIKAIRHLRPHLQANTKCSRRVALIVCIVLTSTDLLRGHFSTAKTHVNCGEKLLLEIDPTKRSQIYKNHNLDLTDTMIAAAFLRLRLQGKLFTYWKCEYDPPLQGGLEPISFKIVTFSSYNEAWQNLAKSMNEAFVLTRQMHNARNTSKISTYELSKRREDIKEHLENWLCVHQSTAYTSEDRYCCSDRVVHGTLKAYHTMISIMVNVCLDAEDEEAYDSQTELFITLLQQLIDLYQLTWGLGVPVYGHKPVHQYLMSRSIVDMGNIPLLYHVITKCRVYRIRIQALRLLEMLNNREGFWDSNIMCRVARRVVEIEERDLHRPQNIREDFQVLGRVQLEEADLTYLPRLHRLNDVEVVLSGSPTDTIFLYCKSSSAEDKPRRICVDQYDVKSERWFRTLSDVCKLSQFSVEL